MKTKFSLIILSGVCLMLAILSCSENKVTIGKKPFDSAIEQKIDSIIDLMTLEEKIGQLNQYSSTWDFTGPAPKDETNANRKANIVSGKVGSLINVFGVKAVREAQKMALDSSRLHIPMIFGTDVIHGYKTIFPIPLAEACSWDMDLIERSSRVAAIEATASGICWTFAPMVDICRDPRWGRIMEGCGEDPYLGSRIAESRVHGFQSEDLSANNTLMACAKHFAAYGAAEGGRDYNTVDMSKWSMMNTILPPFKACVDAGSSTFMNSFNLLNGIPATGNKWLVNETLRDRWGFDGVLVSDWGSIRELEQHGIAANEAECAQIAIHGTTDIDMESSAYINSLKKLVNSGKVEEKLIDDAVRRILRAKFELGLFDDPYLYCSEERENQLVYCKEHLEIARESARKSIVLLKNENNLLPLKKEIKKIAVIGPLANDKDSPLGNWRCMGELNSAVSLLEGIKAIVSPQTTVLYAKGCSIGLKQGAFEDSKFEYSGDKSGFAEALRVAKQSDVVILAVGEEAFMSGEAKSRADLNLPGVQEDLIKAIKNTGKPIVVVLMNGRPLTINWTAENIPAILETWFLGSQAGNAIADVIFGDYNPSGKLTVTFPANVAQIPFYYNHFNTGRPVTDEEGAFTTGYCDIPEKPLYPFGFGLSYTSFEYSNLKLSSDKITANDTLEIEVTITNTGKIAGEETAQLYIRDMVASTVRPVKELKAFRKVFLKAGESQKISFKLSNTDLSFYNENLEFVSEPGDFKVFVGTNSVDLLNTNFVLEKL